MSGTSQRPRAEGLKRALAGALRVELGNVAPYEAADLFIQAGYEVTPWLLEFLANYSELFVAWRSSRGDWENELTTAVGVALEIYPGNLRIYAKRIGQRVLPVGMVFETEERLLLAENGDILLAGDAGIQRVANGFEEAIQLLIANDWDKTFS